MSITNKKELILIPTYCNTKKKVEVLDETIEYIKNKYTHIDIAIYAHHPINVDIQKKINHYIYDYSNPIINEKAVLTWINIHNLKKLYKILADYGYAVLQKITRSTDFFHKLKYEIIYWINYDVDLKTNDIINFFQNREKDNVFINFKTTEGTTYSDGIALYAMKISTETCKFFKKEISREQYIETTSMAEQIFKNIIYNLEKEKYELVDYVVKTKIWSMDILLDSIRIGEKISDFFEKIIVIYDESKDNFCLLIWDLLFFDEINIELLVDEEPIFISSKNILLKEEKVLYFPFNKKPNIVKIIKINNFEINSFIYDKDIEELNKNVFIKDF